MQHVSELDGQRDDFEPPRRGPSRRRGSRTGGSTARRKRMRAIFFGLASAWGFMIGTIGVLASLTAAGSPPTLESRGGVVLLVAGVIAVLGGAVVARAYRGATDRS